MATHVKVELSAHLLSGHFCTHSLVVSSAKYMIGPTEKQLLTQILPLGWPNKLGLAGH